MSHIHKDIDLTASVYIIYKAKVLLVLHKKLKNWLPVGGHVELHEDVQEALTREIREECGLNVTILAPPLPNIPNATDIKFLPIPAFFDIHKITDEHRHMNLSYFGISSTDEAILADGEHDDLRWFTAEEVDDPSWGIWPSIKFYAKKAIRYTQAHNA